MPPFSLTAELMFDTKDRLGEGPVWLPSLGALAWVDITAGAVHVGVPGDGPPRTLALGEHVSAVVPTSEPCVVVAALRSGLALLDLSSGALRRLLTGPWPANIRPNDAKCAPDGALWLGTMDYSEAPGSGMLLRIGPNLSVTTVIEGLTIPNGMDWPGDRRWMFFADSPTRRVERLRFADAATIDARQPFAETGPRGLPDGMTLDAEGGLWVAVNGTGEVRRYSDDGAVIGIVTVPTPAVTSCAFGGPGLGTLFITTSTSLASTEDRRAGSVYACTPGPRGRLPFFFTPVIPE